VIHAIVTDIEGTTSSIAFVHDVLFPFSRARLAAYVRANVTKLDVILDAVRTEVRQPDLGLDACIGQLEAWHDEDRKIAPLKELQGRIWREGFESGAFTGHVYPDAVEGLRRWHAAGIALYIYSSGSVAAQKLLFGHSDAGDLTPLFSGYFDTAIGAKREANAYRAIATAVEGTPEGILFLSDIAEELDAAHEAGLGVTLVARGGGLVASKYPVVDSFDHIIPLEVTT
jgi:enolase-phosphatase E1